MIRDSGSGLKSRRAGRVKRAELSERSRLGGGRDEQACGNLRSLWGCRDP